MNRTLGWILAALMLAAGWRVYGWPGIAMAGTVVVFWLLLQFNRTLRVMRNAGQAPMGRVDSAVMLNARLRRGLTLLQVLEVTKSLGREVAGQPDTWAWADDGGVTVTLHLAGGRLQSWHLTRPESPGAVEVSGDPPASP